MVLIAGIIGLFLGKALNFIAFNFEAKIKLLTPKQHKVPSSILFARVLSKKSNNGVELFMALYCILVYLFIPLSLTMVLLLCLAAGTVILCAVDLKTLKIPNKVLLFLAIAGVMWSFFQFIQALIAITLLLGVGFILKYGFEKVLKKPSLGMGDVKLLGISGLWVQAADIPLYFIIAGILGIMTGVIWMKKKKSAIFPFAPALCAALMITVWQRILS